MKEKRKKFSIDEDILAKVLTAVSGIAAGPLEILFVDVVLNTCVKNEVNSFFWVLGALVAFPVIYAILILIIKLIILRDYHDFDDYWLAIGIISLISVFVTCFGIEKFVNGSGIFKCIVNSTFFTMCSFMFNIVFVAGGGSHMESIENAVPRKIRANTWSYRGMSETTYRDDNGNKVGTVSSIDHGFVKDTVIRDKDGNIVSEIEDWKHKF